LIHEHDTFLGCQVDHVISEKHGGATVAENLAFACTLCNRAKGSDIGSIDEPSGEFVRLFNPRSDRWGDHFALRGHMIEPRTPIGGVTARLLQLNFLERVEERSILMQNGRYPSAELASLVRARPPR
jgi:hypothetical protein